MVENLELFMMILIKHALPNKFVQQASILIRQIKHVFLVEKTAQAAKFTLVNALTKKLEFWVRSTNHKILPVRKVWVRIRQIRQAVSSITVLIKLVQLKIKLFVWCKLTTQLVSYQFTFKIQQALTGEIGQSYQLFKTRDPAEAATHSLELELLSQPML